MLGKKFSRFTVQFSKVCIPPFPTCRVKSDISLHVPTCTYMYLHVPTCTYMYLHVPTLNTCSALNKCSVATEPATEHVFSTEQMFSDYRTSH